MQAQKTLMQVRLKIFMQLLENIYVCSENIYVTLGKYNMQIWLDTLDQGQLNQV